MALAGTAVRSTVRTRYSRLARREAMWGFLCASPWFFGFFVFTAGPMLASIVLSLTRWDLLSAPRFVGFQNYKTLLSGDTSVWHSLEVTTYYALLAVPLHTAFGLFLAILLNQKIRFQRFVRTVYYLPSVVSGVAVALLWQWIFSPDFGLLNTLLSYVGIKGPAWLADGRTVIPAFVIMSLWGVGASMIIYLAGLQGIPTELYEAAQMDGASTLRQFWTVTVPMLSPVIFFNVIMGIIGALQIFTQAYVMTAGGPHDASLFFMLYLYQNAFEYFKMGYASALAWILFFYIMALTLLVIRSSAVWVYYEGRTRGR
ncbi:MAG: sugar ABC transporter permease [Chloroflexi bacterium]|nr:sugar ABC transporter permease [Chloroflexota bacterium]